MAPLLQELKRYSFPLILFVAGLFFQLVVLPSYFPPSHYDALGVRRSASVAEVTEAYQKLESRWSSGLEVPSVADFVKIRYAFEFLTHPLWKRDYDGFVIDEHLHVAQEVKEKYHGEAFSKIKLPLLNEASSDFADDPYEKLSHEDFMSTIGKNKTWLIQVYSTGSRRCAEFSSTWNRITRVLDYTVNTATVDLGESELASFLAEQSYSGKFFFRNGLPVLVAFPPNCRSSGCLKRYEGDLSVDAVIEWVATSILGYPRIFYYSKESLDQHFIAKSGRHKVKVIFFSKTGQRALPFLRKAARDYHTYASFALVWWRDEDASIWFNKFQVESAPSIVFLKDPGVKPPVYYGTWNSSSFVDIMEQNKHQDLPQLRSVTSMELGCDARGKSRAGNYTAAWYCVILAGRPSWELSKMREIMRRVQKALVDNDNLALGKNSFQIPGPAVEALKDRRLTLAWLDGEIQSKYCFFYLHSETSYETCGPRKYGGLEDVPQLFLVRYRRNSTENTVKAEEKVKSIWDAVQHEEDTDLASQLVARYNGTEDISEIIQWISKTIDDGDTRDLPYFRTQTPELVPEDADSVLLQSLQGVLSNGVGVKKKFQTMLLSLYDRMEDPRLGPILLLGACISFGTIWLQKNQTTALPKVKRRSKGRTKTETSVNNVPSSITDVEPKDAYQVLSSESSDSE